METRNIRIAAGNFAEFTTIVYSSIYQKNMKADVSSTKRRYCPWSLMACFSVGGLVIVNLYFSLYSNGRSIIPVSSTYNKDVKSKIKPSAVNNSVEIVPIVYKTSPIAVQHKSKSKEWSWTFPYKPITCSADIVHDLAKPRLAEEDLKFCQWALSSQGGQVEVGKSWGNLRKKEDKERFDSLNCNAVKAGKNPSCDDSWGDAHIRYWRSHLSSKIQCEAGKTDNLQCFVNDNSDMHCVLRNAVLDFSKLRKVDRGAGMTPSK
ncbi:hypothetical protein EON65_57270, partial [archaeon]